MGELDTCDHIRCEFPHRLEYCEIEARDPEGDPAVITEMIQHLLYERNDFERCVEYRNEGRDKYVTRKFQYRHIDGEGPQRGPLLETRINLLHKQTRQPVSDMYQVRLGWRVFQIDTDEEYYETVYTIEPWDHAAYGTIDEYHIATEQLKTGDRPTHRARPMTGYDHEVLFNKLAELDTISADEEGSRSSIN